MDGWMDGNSRWVPSIPVKHGRVKWDPSRFCFYMFLFFQAAAIKAALATAWIFFSSQLRSWLLVWPLQFGWPQKLHSLRRTGVKLCLQCHFIWLTKQYKRSAGRSHYCCTVLLATAQNILLVFLVCQSRQWLKAVIITSLVYCCHSIIKWKKVTVEI